MRIKKFNEEVGFDSEELRDRLEIPNLRGELDPDSPTMKPYSMPLGGKMNTRTELNKVIYKFPILDEFHKNNQIIEGSDLISLYATSKTPVKGNDFYCQLSFALHNDKYFVGTVLRERENVEDESSWVVNNFEFESLDETYDIVSAFIKACGMLGVLDDEDLSQYAISNN
jgi:hypothetical protein